MRASERILGAINPSRRALRWPLKAGLALGVLLLVLFPRLDLLAQNLRHWSDLGALIEPDAPGLSPLVARVQQRLAGQPGADPAAALQATQDVVYEAIPYAWDWDTWWVADYVPTVGETLRAGREDCDGRAVVAASILRRLGYDARLMSDLGHVWVWTPEGQTMNPGETASGEVFVQQDDQGRRVLNWRAVLSVRALVHDWGRNLAYGIAVFPAWREGIILLTAWVLLLPRRARWGRALAFLGVAAAGWMLVRATSHDYWSPSIGAAWGGLGLASFGLVATMFSGVGRRAVVQDAPPPE